MGLDVRDRLTEGILLKDAYKKIKKWYSSNIHKINVMNDDYRNRSINLVNNLPHENLASELEMRAVLGEVIHGNLEWGYHESDGRFKMAAYSLAAFETLNIGWAFNDAEKEILKSSELWKFLIISR
jgi:hypothetical protein